MLLTRPQGLFKVRDLFKSHRDLVLEVRCPWRQNPCSFLMQPVLETGKTVRLRGGLVFKMECL